MVKKVVDDVFILKDIDSLFKITLFMLLSAFVMQAGFFLSRISVITASERVLRDIREEVFAKILRLPSRFFVKAKGGDLVSRIVSDVDKLRQVLVDQFPTLMREPFVGLALLGVLLYRDPTLTVILFGVVPLMAYTVKFFGSKKGKHFKRSQEATGQIAQVISQTVQGIDNLKVFNAHNIILRFFKEFNKRVYKASVKAEFYVTGNTALNYIFGYTVVAGVLFYGGFRIARGDLTPGDFISFLTALFMIQPPLLGTQRALMNLRGALPVIGRVREILKSEEERDGGKTFQGLRKELVFNDVRVKAGDKEILKGVSLKIAKGERVGIVGRTGSGKSTLVKILPRLLDYEGSVKIDGTELSEFSLESVRSKIGFSTQEVFILNGTVRENLLIAKKDATEEEMKRALDLAVCDFVDRIGGLDAQVGERGYALSGGERQRLSLARIFLKNPDIVILDEATSALDMNTEKKVLKNLFEFFKDRTMIVVAHRLSNIVDCDRIVVIKEGRVVEEGTFYSLIEKKGEFYNLFKEAKALS